MQKNNKKVLVLVFDSFGIGSLPDSDKFGDVGSNTLGNIDKYCVKNNLEFKIPHLLSLGLANAYNLVNETPLVQALKNNYKELGSYAACKEVSSGKDTTSGHWEIAGAPVSFDWGYFTNHTNSFPEELLDKIVAKSGISGFLGNCHASGTDIIDKLGVTHLLTNKPIFYTSADSVFQIACHEESFGLDNLYKLCKLVREELKDYNIARVIARPFLGNEKIGFKRTSNRKDYSVKPSLETLFDVCVKNNVKTIGIGKIGDIYAHQNVNDELSASGLDQLIDVSIKALDTRYDCDAFIMTNLVNFDMDFGHRRNILGYKEALELVDLRIKEVLDKLTDDDLLIITADHGCDPSWSGTDHTREYIPFLMYNKNKFINQNLSVRDSFADIGQTIAKYLDIPSLKFGKPAI